MVTVSNDYLAEVLEAVSQRSGDELKEARELVLKYFPAKKLMSKKEAAAMLNCSTRQIDYLRENYNLPWSRLGEVIRFDADKLQDWLKTQDGTGTSSVPSLAKKSKMEATEQAS